MPICPDFSCCTYPMSATRPGRRCLIPTGTNLQKRKKTSRACNHCHKAHMTCDTSRPCRRCILRNLESSCEDAPRKRKKYLSDVPAALIQLQPDSDSSANVSTMANTNQNSSVSDAHLFQATLFQQSSSLPGYLTHRTSELTKTQSVSAMMKLNGSNSFPSQNFEASSRFFAPENGLKNGDNAQHRNGADQSEQYGTNSLPSDRNRNLNQNPNQNQNLNQDHEQIQNPIQDPNQQHNENLNHNQDQDHSQNGINIALDQGMAQNFQSKRNGIQRKRTNFLSSAADLEYSTLSSILQDNFLGMNHTALATSTEGTPSSVLSPALSPHAINQGQHMGASPTSLGASGLFNSSLDAQMQHESMNPVLRLEGNPEYPPCDTRINQYFLGTQPNQYKPYLPEVLKALDQMSANDPAAYYARNSQLTVSFAVSTLGGNTPELDSLRFKEPEEIYAKITKPFSYTPGFHKLIAYLRGRFPREMLVKMAESMSVYRPSFIACTNSLHETDLIFMEQCFQRTLLTYDNFIKVSGTPTIVWRRTGEIAYVGKEFTVLTGWTQEQIMGPKPMFIVELLDDKSVVEYFELFSRIAFGDFLGATMTECTLLTPDRDVKIRAGCIWTLKRDVFGIPMMILGNFLPIV